MTSSTADLTGVTQGQQRMWATGDFHRIGVSQLIVGERLARSLRVRSGERVLDVAGGAGNTALACARRWADVTCTDYVPELLEHARRRAEAEGLPLRTEVADAQALPYSDALFDVVTSTFGAMFAPDQGRTASELLRVVRPGGRIGLASWTPEGWVGAKFALAAEVRPLPPGVRPSTVWGTREGVQELLGDAAELVSVRERVCEFVYHSAAALFDLFAEWFGPTASLVQSLDPQQRETFRSRWVALAEEHSTADDGTLCIPAAYLEVVAVKRG